VIRVKISNIENDNIIMIKMLDFLNEYSAH
jgi:hypothetical protein